MKCCCWTPPGPTTGGDDGGPTTGGGPGGSITGGGRGPTTGGKKRDPPCDGAPEAPCEGRGGGFKGTTDVVPPLLRGSAAVTVSQDDSATVQSEDEAREELILLRQNTAVLSDWMQRQGDYLRALADLVAKSSADLVVTVLTKKDADAGDGTDVSPTTKITQTQVGRGVQEWGPQTGSGLKELVRYKFTCSTQALTGWILFRMLDEVWFDAVRAN